MPNKSIAMNKLRAVLRLYTEGRSKLFISHYCRTSRNTVKKYVPLFRASKLAMDQIDCMSRYAAYTLSKKRGGSSGSTPKGFKGAFYQDAASADQA